MLTVPETLVARAAEARRLTRRGYANVGVWLDERAFPAIVRYATSRPHIVALVLIGLILMLDSNTLVQLRMGNYTNIVSALVSCIVLLQQVSHHREVKRLHAKHDEQLTALHAKVDALSATTTPPTPPTPPTPLRAPRTPRPPTP